MITIVKSRPRNAAATRDAILDAARDRFSRESYDDVGLREIARDVGVDASLVSRYFGSKEELFAAVLDSCDKGAELMDGPRESFGRRTAERVVYDRKDGEALQGMQILLRSIGSARASELVHTSANVRFFGPFVDWLGGSDAPVRAHLILSLIMGLSIGREMSDGFNMTPAQRGDLSERLAGLLQALVDNTFRNDAP